MIRRCHHHICMSLVSAVTPARSRSRPTFAICGVPSPVWQRERRRRHSLVQSVRFLSSSPSIFPLWPEDVQNTSVCIWSCGPTPPHHRRRRPSRTAEAPGAGKQVKVATSKLTLTCLDTIKGSPKDCLPRGNLRVIHQQHPQNLEHYGYRNAEFFQVFFFRRSN